jgi:ABC-2 type transport system permease protein
MSTTTVILLGEVRKHLLIAWKYRTNTILRLFTGSFLLISLYFLIGEGVISSVKNNSFFVAFLAWMYAVAPMGAMTYSLRSEMFEGTLEQMTMSPLPLSVLMAGRLFGTLLVNTLEIIIMGLSTWLILRVNLILSVETLVILLVIIVGVSGFAYLVAGGVLVFKEFESFINIFVNVLMLLNGTLYPIERMPAWLRAFALTLPSTQGIVILRKMTLEGVSLRGAWQDGSLPWLVVHSLIYLVAGLLVFLVCERLARKQGSLGAY